MRLQKNNIGKYILLLTPFLLGSIGLCVFDAQPVIESLFQSMEMYFLNYSDTPPNLLVELARWLAPLATASGVLLTIDKVRALFLHKLQYYCGDSVAVYGDERHRKEVVRGLGRKGIDAGDEWNWIKADKYLLLGKEDETLGFYCQHREKFKEHIVYIQSCNLTSQNLKNPELRLFCPEETAARLYWKQRCLYEVSCKHNHHFKIVLLGVGCMGEKLLEYALQYNIFDPGQRIEYHVFGNGKEFQALHRELHQINDPVVFHKECWYENYKILEEAKRILVLPQDGQLRIVEKLLSATTEIEFDVLVDNDSGFDLLAERERLHLFYWEKEAWNLENIFDEVMFEQAKKLNLHYAYLYNGTEENLENMELEWKKLDSFTRYSNVSAADYHEIRVHMMQVLGWNSKVDQLSQEQLEMLTELEHIRWSRYHQIHNWHHGIPQNGKNKDVVHRIHKDLIPYCDLEESEKEKDRDNIRMLQKLFDYS